MRVEPLAHEAAVLAAVKKMTLFAAGVASQRFMTALEEQQEIMADLADMISQVFALESALVRAQKIASAGRSYGRSCGSHDRHCWPKKPWRLPNKRRGACSRLAVKATRCIRSWRFCGGWRDRPRPM